MLVIILKTVNFKKVVTLFVAYQITEIKETENFFKAPCCNFH